MEQVDFAKIISAAAVSTLGVLSLIVVALGVIGFYFFKGSGDRVKLGVWLAMLLAAALFAAAVIKQGAPAEEHRPPDPQPTRTPEPDDGPMEEPSQAPTPAAPSASPTPSDEPDDLSGRWHDSDGYLYDVQVNDTVFAYQQWLNGQYVGYGRGTVSGRRLTYRYVSAQAGQGGCTAIVAIDTRSISGTCTADGGGSWPFSVER